MTIDIRELKTMIKNFRKTYPVTKYKRIYFNNQLFERYEIELLSNLKAIGTYGILRDYPVLKIIDSERNERTIDVGGDIQKANAAAIEFLGSPEARKLKATAKVDFVPRTYSLFVQAKIELGDEEAEMRDKEKQKINGVMNFFADEIGA